MSKKKITMTLITGLLVTGSLITPAYADNTTHNDQLKMHHETISRSDDSYSSDTKWWNNKWRNNWNWKMRDENSDRNLSANLRGNKEVPGPGDEDGRGNVTVRVQPGKERICLELQVRNIDPATAAHIHRGERGVAGPVVVNLPTPNAEGNADGCVTASKELLKEMKKDSSDFYVNIHNAAYPDGAVRGQLQN